MAVVFMTNKFKVRNAKTESDVESTELTTAVDGNEDSLRM